MNREHAWLVVLALAQVGVAAGVAVSAMSCKEVDPSDVDGDGYPDGADCDDTNPNIHPAALEGCQFDGSPNGVDENCDGLVDEGCLADADGDGFAEDVDCNDANAQVNPGLREACLPDGSPNGVDENCSGAADEGCAVDAGTGGGAGGGAGGDAGTGGGGGNDDAGTGGGTGGGGGDAGSGLITSFTTSSASVPEGSSVTLTWTSTADSCSLMPSQFSALPANHTLAVQVDVTTTFTLTCFAGGVSESRTLDVTATPAPPAITSFMAQSVQVSTGMNAELSWTTVRATACTLDPGAQVASVSSGSASLPISATTTYTLTCTGAVGPAATQSVTVTYVANAAPVAVIDSPANGATVEAGTVLNFSATCTDDGAGGTTLTHYWSGPTGGLVGTTEDLPPRTAGGSGLQTWSYSCTDALGSQTTVQVTFTVVQPVFTRVAGGNTHSCALTASGRVLCWGNNANGQVGVPGAAQHLTPTAVSAATDWASLATGYNLSCALNTGGQLWCWGTQAGGIGDGVAMTRATPTLVDSATDWARVSIGVDFACGLKTTGSVWCWGTNANGQLGQGNTTDSPTPVRVGTASDWLTLDTGVTYACGVRTGGTAWCWGDNSRGNLGDNSLVQRTAPVQVGPTVTWQSLTAGSLSTCGLSTAGALYCWGWDVQGQLGDGSPSSTAYTRVPTRVGMDSDWAQVSEGGLFTCARKTTGSLWCWGSDVSGQQGNGAAYSVAVPTQVGTATDWTDIYAADSTTLGVRSGGLLWGWGLNGAGQVGLGSTTPNQVEVPTAVVP
ncbi:MAG: hypothetical protein IT380_18445 [Myxococcales bacterium]|nr:hypothetical protein [Myxococcales bacterium]